MPENIKLPKDLESERYLISSLLQKPERIADVAKILRPEDFYDPDFGIIYDAIISIDPGQGESILNRVKEEFISRGIFNRIGGAPAIIKLRDACVVPSNALGYARKIRKKSIDRDRIKNLYSAIECIQNEEDEDTIRSLCIGSDLFVDSPEDEDRQAEKNPSLDFPDDVISGLAGDFALTYSKHLESPTHFFYFSFLTCLGSMLSYKIRVNTEAVSQPRLYTLILGESADDRKSTVIDKTVKFFAGNLYVKFNTCRGIGSAEGLVRKLEKIRKQQGKENKDLQLLLCFDEFKSFVSKASIDTSVLLTCVNSLFEANCYESGTKTHDIVLENVHLSTLAASTLETYQKIWRTSYTDIGFDNRLWLVPGTSDRSFSVPENIPKSDTERLLTKFRHILQFTANGYAYELTKEAFELYDDWYHNREKSVYSRRLDGYALRFMPLLAVNDTKIEIDNGIVEKAIALVEWQLKVRKELSPIDADNAVARLEEGIRRQLTKGSLKQYELKRKIGANRTGLFIFNAAIKNLINAKEIKFDKYTKKYKLINEYYN